MIFCHLWNCCCEILLKVQSTAQHSTAQCVLVSVLCVWFSWRYIAQHSTAHCVLVSVLCVWFFLFCTFCVSFTIGHVPLSLHVNKRAIELNYYGLVLPIINFSLSAIWPGIILQFVISSFLYFVLHVSPFVFNYCNILLCLLLYDFVAASSSRKWPTDCFSASKKLEFIWIIIILFRTQADSVYFGSLSCVK